MILQRIYNFTNQNKATRSLVGFVLGFTILTVMYVLGSLTVNAAIDNYYRNASPKDFVDFYSVSVADAPVGSAPQITLCRKIKSGSVDIEAVRTFIKYQDGKSKEVGQRKFMANISHDRNNTDCTSFDLQGQPPVAGKYSIHTDYTFYVYNADKRYKKRDYYDSNNYKITDTAIDLQRQIDELKKRLEARLEADRNATPPRTTSSAPAATVPPKKNAAMPAAGTNSGNDQSTTDKQSQTGNPLIDGFLRLFTKEDK